MRIRRFLSLELDVFFSSKIDFVDFLIKVLVFIILSSVTSLPTIKSFYGFSGKMYSSENIHVFYIEKQNLVQK